MLSPRDIAWAAGLFEGEGSFGTRPQGITASITMTDRDVIDRFSALFPFGTRYERILPSGKTAYRWCVTKQSAAAGLMMTLYALMGSRRQSKIRECLAAWRARPLPKRMWTVCKHGHPLAGENLRIVHEGTYVKRRCVECARLRQRKYRATSAVV